MHKWSFPADTIGKMHDCETVGKSRVVSHHCGKILPDQKGRTAIDRHGQLCLVVRAGEGSAIGARNTNIMPRSVGAIAVGAGMSARRVDLAAPGFAAAIFAALDQE